ncbi:MAG TPA: hypothetical protein VNI20_01625, partial [Fimbriimonadaceae bacterium]|nr:hypothetical protein [Fimbriimonadaceae bacterium]
DVAKELLQLVGQDHVVVSSRQPRRGWGAPNSQFYGSNDKSGTEVVAGGMPANAVLRVSTMRQDVIYRQPSEGKKPDYGHTSDEIGQQIANADVYSPNGSTPLRPYFVIATAEQLYIEVEFPGVGYYSRIVQIDHLPSNVVYMTLKELPQDVQDQIAKAADKYRVFYKRLKGGGGEKL